MGVTGFSWISQVYRRYTYYFETSVYLCVNPSFYHRGVSAKNLDQGLMENYFSSPSNEVHIVPLWVESTHFNTFIITCLAKHILRLVSMQVQTKIKKSTEKEKSRKIKEIHLFSFLPSFFFFWSMCLLFVPSSPELYMNASKVAPGSAPAHDAHFNDLGSKHLAFIFSCNWKII